MRIFEIFIRIKQSKFVIKFDEAIQIKHFRIQTYF